ncbi:MAG: hypothetical protein KDI64_11265, partial [Candidatus Accumulibacter sp.]|nr:hypothetical protein [Accumulibacter sp.]
MRTAAMASTRPERSQRPLPSAARTQAPEAVAENGNVHAGVPQYLDASTVDAAPEADAGGAAAEQQVDSALSRSSDVLDAGLNTQGEEQDEAQPVGPETEPAPAAGAAAAPHHGPTQSAERPPGPPPLELGEGAPGRGSGAAAGAGSADAGAAGEAGDGTQEEVGDAAAPEGEANAAGGTDSGGAAAGESEGGADGGSGSGRQEGAGGGAGLGGEAAAEATLEALATGDIALIDEELAEHQRWGTASARVGAAGSTQRADFIVDQAGAGALGGLGHGALMGAAVGAGSQALEIGAARLVGRLAGPALARSFPLPAIGAVIGGVFSAYDLATRDWGHTGETIGRFGEGGSIYEQLANSIAAVSEIIGIATAVLNVIAGVIGAISIAMWVITVL